MRSARFFALAAPAVIAVTVIAATGPAAADQHMEKTLYQRLGGYDAIAAVTDDFIGRLAGDPSVSRFFVGHSNDSKGRIRQHVVDFVCKVTGGPCAYQGRSIKVAHEGLGITEADWDTAVKLLGASLDKFKVGAPEKSELLAAVSSLKPDIVGAAVAKK